MSTKATRKQSAAIRDQMQMIRCDLPYSVDTARREVKQLADWKYYVRTFPITTVLGAAAVGYAVVPKRQDGQHKRSGDNRSAAAKPSIIEGLIAAGTAMLVRNGASMLMGQLSNQFFNGRGDGRGSLSGVDRRSAGVHASRSSYQ